MPGLLIEIRDLPKPLLDRLDAAQGRRRCGGRAEVGARGGASEARGSVKAEAALDQGAAVAAPTLTGPKLATHLAMDNSMLIITLALATMLMVMIVLTYQLWATARAKRKGEHADGSQSRPAA